MKRSYRRVTCVWSTAARDFRLSDNALVDHGIYYLNKAGDSGPGRVVTGNTESFGGFFAHFVDVLHNPFQSSVDFPFDQLSRMLFCDISSPETDTAPTLAALPGAKSTLFSLKR